MYDRLQHLLQGPLYRSRLMRTAPVDVGNAQPDYCNMVCSGIWADTPLGCLAACERLEQTLGRAHKGRRRARTADIDIILFGKRRMRHPRLVLPHPALWRRRYLLEGIHDIAPQLCIPGTQWTVAHALQRLDPEIRAQRVEYINF
jgi:2-amino-4-hydroxy-6-hydroxymethyldihydropteridine diphosphokinase